MDNPDTIVDTRDGCRIELGKSLVKPKRVNATRVSYHRKTLKLTENIKCMLCESTEMVYEAHTLSEYYAEIVTESVSHGYLRTLHICEECLNPPCVLKPAKR